MSRNRRALVLAVVICLCLAFSAFAQDAVPSEILNRTLLIRVGNVYGTAFTLDYKGKLYLITAKHVVAGLPQHDAIIETRRAGKWSNFPTVKTIFPSSPDVDIAIFETSESVSEAFQVTPEVGAAMGQQVWFLGYPYGISSHLSGNFEAPFIKRGTMSAIDTTNPNAVVIYIDGFNNPGFSGGPIVYWDLDKHAYRILGVVQGYRADTARLLVNGKQIDTQILVNSGILIGYSIDHAVRAIEKDRTK